MNVISKCQLVAQCNSKVLRLTKQSTQAQYKSHYYSTTLATQWSFRKLTTMGTPKLSAEGAKFEAPKALSIERRRRENRSAEGAERGRVWGGVSPPQPTRESGGAS